MEGVVGAPSGLERLEARHAGRLREAWEVRGLRTDRERRGPWRQGRRRMLERSLKRAAVGFVRMARRQKVPLAAAAERVGIRAGTLASWTRGWRQDRLAIRLRGRCLKSAEKETRRQIIALFCLMGPGVGLSVLAGEFPGVARGELVDLQRRYRNIHLRFASTLVHMLTWRRAGAVWAMDFKKPAVPVDGRYRKILLVRDLASGQQLLALPIPEEGAREVIDALTVLFREHGLPLVVKSDNGSPFIAEETAKFLEGCGVLPLLSPKGMPEYNGACEAGVGSLSVRAHHEAARNGRPGEWTCDDVEGARLQANETARPAGHAGPTPDEAWARRVPLTAEERAAFAATVAEVRREARAEACAERGAPLPGFELLPSERDSIERIAISRALIKREFLSIRRKRIPLPINLRRDVKIS